MSQNVIPQVDVGSLTLKGLSAFTPLLAALTTDNVAPMTMIQLENLGALFHINGPYAAKVPDLLRRCSSFRMESLALTIGWRKGDSASIMAQSSGGQAVALLCFCLENTCAYRSAGGVLYDLSEALLARSLSVHSSVNQLTAVAGLLAAKLQVLGFGNILAAQVLKIQDVYAQLGLSIPLNFFDFMTRESMVDLFCSLATIFEREDTILRISGVHTMGHILTVLLIMFPDNIMLTIEGLIVREGPRVSIIVEIGSSPGQDSPSIMLVETKFEGSSEIPMLIEVVPRPTETPYTFKWSGHVADALDIEFGTMGLRFSEELKEACCGVLVSSLGLLNNYSTLTGPPLPSKGFQGLLGTEPVLRMSQICREIFRAELQDMPRDFTTEYGKLVGALRDVLGDRVTCICSHAGRCDFGRGFQNLIESRGTETQECLLRRSWIIIAVALERGYFCCLVDAQKSSSCGFNTNPFTRPSVNWFRSTIGIRKITDFICEEKILSNLDCRELYTRTLYTFGWLHHEEPLAVFNGACTMFSARLLDFEADIEKGYRFMLLDGQLMVKGRYHKALNAALALQRQKALKSLPNPERVIRPSSSGEHTHLFFTVREHAEFLELRTTTIVRGHSVHLNLADVIIASMGLENVPACEHDASDQLDPTHQADVVTISIANISSSPEEIGIVQTMGNPTAQMLACDERTRSVLQRNSCLNCAVAYAKKTAATQIIVAM